MSGTINPALPPTRRRLRALTKLSWSAVMCLTLAAVGVLLGVAVVAWIDMMLSP